MAKEFMAETVYKGVRYRKRCETHAEKVYLQERWRKGVDLPNRDGAAPKVWTTKETFQEYLDNVGRLKESTLALRRRHLDALVKRLPENVADISKARIEDLEAHLLRRRLRPGTVGVMIATLLTVLRWAHDREMRGPVPAYAVLKSPTQPKALSEEQISIVLAHLDRLDPEVGRFVRIMIVTGLRLGDAMRLDANSVRTDGSLEVTTQKTGSLLVLPVPPDIARMVLDTCPPSFSVDRFNRLLRRVKKEAKLPFLHAHVFRHTCATRIIRHNAGNIAVAAKILGHRRIQTTIGTYGHLVSEDTRKAIQATPQLPPPEGE